MSETPENSEMTPAQVPADQPAEQKVVSRRGRRLLIAIIIILVLALIGITALLAGLVLPRGGVASGEDSGDIEWVRSIYGWGQDATQQFTVPRKATVGPDGTIWVTDSVQVVAFGFNPEGQLVKTIGNNAETTMTALGAIEVGVEDRLFMGQTELDRVRVFSDDDVDLGTFAIPSPTDISYRDGTMVIGSVAGFALVDAESGVPEEVIGTRGTAPDQFDTVGGVTIAPDGTIYAVDTFNNRLNAYSADGEQLWQVQTGKPGNDVDITDPQAMQSSQDASAAPAALQLPADVCVDGNGRVLVIDSFDFSIAVFDPANGEFLTKYGAFGTQDGQFRYPSSISYDPQRDWFVVADTGNARVQIVRIPDSAPFSLGAAARRSLSGPLRACVAPLLILLALLVLFIVQRVRRRRQARALAQGVAQPAPLTDVEKL